MAVRLDAGGDDVVDHIVGLDTPEAAGVQAVVAGHAGMDLRPGLEHLELHPGGLHLPPDHLQHLGGVAVLSGTAVDGHDLHKLPLHNLVSPCCPSIIAEGWTAGKSSFSPIKRDALTGVSLGTLGKDHQRSLSMSRLKMVPVTASISNSYSVQPLRILDF